MHYGRGDSRNPNVPEMGCTDGGGPATIPTLTARTAPPPEAKLAGEEKQMQEHTTFAEWTEFRVSLLREDGAPEEYIRGFRDYAEGRPEDNASVVGEPFAAWDYIAGYGQARYEIGPLDYAMAEEIAA